MIERQADVTVPLVFLDTPQIGLLARVRRDDPGRYSAFLNVWNTFGCTLVLTLAQEHELRRYENPAGRELRYQLLADLAPIRRDVCTEHQVGDPCTLIEREILGAVRNRGMRILNGPAPNQLRDWSDVLPGRLTASEVGLLRAAEDKRILQVLNMEHNAAQFSAAAAKADAKTKTEHRVRDLPSNPPTAEEAMASRQQMDKILAQLGEQPRSGDSPAIAPDLLNWVSTLVRSYLSRVEEIGPQAALLEYLPVARFAAADQQKPTTEELAIRWFFEFQVRWVARNFLNASETEEESLIKTLDFVDCPGSWLQRRLDVCAGRSSGKPEASHHFDSQRLAYLPYVDLLLTDHEMAEFVRQIQRDGSTPPRIREFRPPLSIANTIDALEEALRAASAPQNR
ncbi:MAG: hypothetical protein LAP13_22420 [Acidobacteriia bacterium]|nr:hypothetical protein [Terriglobia bacterium]